MPELTGDERLRDDERWVRHSLERAIGPTRVIDWQGGPQSQHDLEADRPDGKIAAIEITSEADRDRLSMGAAAKRHLSGITVPGSRLVWHIQLTTEANARALSKPAGLVTLLTDMEQQGHTDAWAMSDYRDPWRDRLIALGIQAVHGFAAGSAPRGTVYVVPGIVAGWGWARASADKWIADFLASAIGKDHLDKLATASAAERHLAVLIHPDTEAGLGIAAALGDMREGALSEDYLPSVTPPSPLTHLWLIAPTVPTRAFLWRDRLGWAAVEPEPL